MTDGNIGRKIEDARKACGMSVQEAAERIGICEKMYTAFEAGTIRPDMEALSRIAAGFGKDVAAIYDPVQSGCGQEQINCQLLIARARRIRAARIYCGYSTKEVAEAQALSQKQYEDIENGYPAPEPIISDIARMLGVNLRFLETGAV